MTFQKDDYVSRAVVLNVLSTIIAIILAAHFQHRVLGFNYILFVAIIVAVNLLFSIFNYKKVDGIASFTFLFSCLTLTVDWILIFCSCRQFVYLKNAFAIYPNLVVFIYLGYSLFALLCIRFLLLIRFTDRYKEIAYLRKFLYIFTVLFFSSLTVLPFLPWTAELMNCEGGGMATVQSFIIVFFLLLFYNPIFIFFEKNYVLFLRSFEDDEIVSALYSAVKEHFRMPVMRIGNPRHIRGYDSFFLPSGNWKFHLDYYISRASKICASIATTEGVLWELFEHQEYADRFLYYVSDIKGIKPILKTLGNKYDGTPLKSTLNELYNNPPSCSGDFLFDINGAIYKADSSIHRIDEISSTGIEAEPLSPQKNPFSYTILDASRSLISNTRDLYNSVSRKLSYLLDMFFMYFSTFILFPFSCLVSVFTIIEVFCYPLAHKINMLKVFEESAADKFSFIMLLVILNSAPMWLAISGLKEYLKWRRLTK